MSDSLQPHGLKHARLPCPSPSPWAWINSCSVSQWCHPTTLMTDAILCRPLLLLPSIFPSIRAFLISQFFISGGQSIGASVSASDLPMNIQDWFPVGLTGLMFNPLIKKYLFTLWQAFGYSKSAKIFKKLFLQFRSL